MANLVNDSEIANYRDPSGDPNPEVGALRNHNSRNSKGTKCSRSFALPIGPNEGGKLEFIITNKNNFYVPGFLKPKKTLGKEKATKNPQNEKSVVFCVVNKTETMNPKEAIFVPKGEGLKSISTLTAYLVAGDAIKQLKLKEEQIIGGRVVEGSIKLDNYLLNPLVYGQVERKPYQGVKALRLTLTSDKNMLD